MQQQAISQRIHGLDYLRGFAAFGIMVFHYLKWTVGSFGAEDFLGRVGIYGVSVFYVLSGLTLYSVYQQKMQPTADDLSDFFKKRVFRIFPLLWLVSLITVFVYDTPVDLKRIVLNLTGLFGFVAWDNSLAVGAWSIGNELVFYVFFPVFVFLSKKNKTGLAVFTIFLSALAFYFAVMKLNNSDTLSHQWRDYINPLNQVFLFLAGYLTGLIFNAYQPTRTFNAIIILTAAAIFIFYPASGDEIVLVTGIRRFIFSFCCIALTFGFYKFDFPLPGLFSKAFKILGEISYALYLLHPLFYDLSGRLMKLSAQHFYTFPETVRVLLAMLLTLGGSYIVYHRFERYFMKLSKSTAVRTDG